MKMLKVCLAMHIVLVSFFVTCKGDAPASATELNQDSDRLITCTRKRDYVDIRFIATRGVSSPRMSPVTSSNAKANGCELSINQSGQESAKTADDEFGETGEKGSGEKVPDASSLKKKAKKEKAKSKNKESVRLLKAKDDAGEKDVSQPSHEAFGGNQQPRWANQLASLEPRLSVDVQMPCSALLDPVKDLDGDGKLDCIISHEQKELVEVIPELDGMWKIEKARRVQGGKEIKKFALFADHIVMNNGGWCAQPDRIQWDDHKLNLRTQLQLPVVSQLVARFSKDGTSCREGIDSFKVPCTPKMWRFELVYPGSECTSGVVGSTRVAIAKLFPDGKLIVLLGERMSPGMVVEQPPLMKDIHAISDQALNDFVKRLTSDKESYTSYDVLILSKAGKKEVFDKKLSLGQGSPQSLSKIDCSAVKSRSKGDQEPSTAPKAVQGTLKFVTWNVDSLFDGLDDSVLVPWRGGKQQADERIKKVQEMLRDMNADMLNIVEVESCSILDQIAPRGASVKNQDPYVSYLAGGPSTHHGVQVGLVSRVRLERGMVERIELQQSYPPVDSSLCPFPSMKSIKPVLHSHYVARFKPVEGHYVMLLGLQLTEDCNMRLEQAQIIREKIKEELKWGDKHHVIVMVDLNDYEDTQSTDGKEGVRRMLTDLNDDGQDDMYSVGSKLAKQDRYTAWEDINFDGVYQEKTESFWSDHILVSKSLWPCVHSIGVERLRADPSKVWEPLLGSHYPLWVKIDFAKLVESRIRIDFRSGYSGSSISWPAILGVVLTTGGVLAYLYRQRNKTVKKKKAKKKG